MMDAKRHTPSGFNDLLPDAYRRKREAERRIASVFESYGYQFVSAPMLEYLAVFEGMGSIPSAEIYKFVDRDGRLLALRPDMTPPAARIAATYAPLGLGIGPVRICYVEQAFRNHETFQGKADAFTQAGAELIGVSSLAADAEMIAVAVRGLMATGLRQFRIDIGQVDFLHGILEESGLDEPTQMAALKAVIRHDYVAAEKLVNACPMPGEPGAREVLMNLTQWVGGLSMLNRVKTYAKSPKALAALTHLEAVYAHLADEGLGQYVLFDLSMTGHFDYYTGVIFKGYAEGSGYTVVSGGRYDRLLTAFGKPGPAVGFGVKVDGVVDALVHQAIPYDVNTPETLLMYREGARSEALRVANALRAQKVIVENSLLGDDLAANKAYAKQKKMGGIVFVIGDGQIKLIDLNEDTEKDVSMEAITGGVEDV